MGWGKWFEGDSGLFSDDSGDQAQFRNSTDNKDGSFRTERLVREQGTSNRYHDIAKGSSDGTQYKEIYTERHNDEKGNESYK